MHILIYLGPSAVAISRLIPRADEYCETCQFLYLSPCFVKISHTPGFISLMEQFTPPTMRGEGDRKNDARFLNTLKYNPNIGSPVLSTEYWEKLQWREYWTEGEWLWWSSYILTHWLRWYKLWKLIYLVLLLLGLSAFLAAAIPRYTWQTQSGESGGGNL